MKTRSVTAELETTNSIVVEWNMIRTAISKFANEVLSQKSLSTPDCVLINEAVSITDSIPSPGDFGNSS